MFASDSSSSHLSTYSAEECPPVLERLILIDGANFMHSVKTVYPSDSTFDQRPNALPLAFFVHNLLSHGHNVRVCILQHMLHRNIIQNFYAIEVLSATGLLIQSKLNGKEADDVCLLTIAREYGAVIISNDKYTNHRNFLDVPANRFFGFRPVSIPFDADTVAMDYSHLLRVQAEVEIYASYEQFLSVVRVPIGAPIYPALLTSQSRFPIPKDFRLLSLLYQWYTDSTYLMVFLELPPTSQFVGEINDFPTSFIDYWKMWCKKRKKVFLAALSVSVGGAIHFGFQLVIIDPSQDSFIDFVKDSIESHYGSKFERSVLEDIWSVIVSMFFVGAIVGALTLQLISEKFGRRMGLVFAYFINSFSAFLSTFSYFINSFEVYTVSRITLGFGLCLSVGIGALYLSEISPKKVRGIVGMSTGISVQLGLVLGALFAMPNLLGSKTLWWTMYLVEGIIFIFALFAIKLFPDSPGYLLKSGETDLAKYSLTFFQGTSDEELKVKIEELKTEVEGSTQKGMIEVLRIKEKRERVLISVIVMFGTAFSGVAAINAFAVDILESSGLSSSTSSYINVGLSFVSLLAACFSSAVVDKVGRRPLLLWSNTGILVCNVLIGGLLLAHDHNSSSLLSVSLIICMAFFLIFFALGPGPLGYFIPSELSGQNSRSATQGWTSLTQMTSRAILLAAFLPLKLAVGSGLCYIILFIAPITAATTYLYFNLPETKNRDQKEIAEAFNELPRFWRAKKMLKSTLYA
ncbi:hypothetical protein FO519_001461 [Halicephalobus sp. NKZ332]|nr:hypothetical protein FO519_001461 [Halicephalobus sp. NKZ332]